MNFDLKGLNSSDDLRKLFETPVKCLLRIDKSIELWIGEFGAEGYFNFIEDQMGHLVDKDEKMNYSMMLKDKNDFKKLGIDGSSFDKHFFEDSEE